MKQPAVSHFNRESVATQHDSHVVYQLNLQQGYGTALVYPVLPGAELIYLAIQANRYIPSIHNRDDILEINYCSEGRTECVMGDDRLQYVGEGICF